MRVAHLHNVGFGVFNCQQILTKISVIFNVVVKKQIEAKLQNTPGLFLITESGYAWLRVATNLATKHYEHRYP